MAQTTKIFDDVLLGFSAGGSPVKSVRAKVGEKPKDGGHDGGHKDGGHKDGGYKDGGYKDGGFPELPRSN